MGEEKEKILVDAATVVEAITTVEWSDEQTKRFNKNNILRLNDSELKEQYPEISLSYYATATLTLLHGIEINNKENLVFENIDHDLPDMVFAESELGNIDIKNCQWATKNEVVNMVGGEAYLYKSTTEDIDISESTTGDFDISESTTGNIDIRESTTGNFYIRENTTGNFYIRESTTGNFDIRESTTGNFDIRESTTGNFDTRESTTGNFDIRESTTEKFYIREKSTTGKFDIREKSTTGYFYIMYKSTTGYFDISESTTGNFYISESTTEDFDIKESTTGYFDISESTTGDFDIKESTTGGVGISESTTGYFDISESTIEGFYIIEKSITGDIDISESITGDIDISESTTGNFDISESTTGYFDIMEKSTTGNLKIKESYTGDFFIEESNSPLWEIENCFASFRFSKAIIGQCKLVDCSISQLQIENQCEMELYISGGQINHLNFKQLTLGKNSIVSLSSVQVYLCNMFEFTVLGNLYFRDIGKAENILDFFSKAQPKPEYILWTDEEYNRNPNENNTAWKNYYAKIKAYSKHIKALKGVLEGKLIPTFRIVKSSLAKTEFTECDLKSFRVEYKHAKLTDVFISGGTVPDNDLKVYGIDENTTDNNELLTWHEQKAAFFNQLKKVFAQQGNVYRETQYNSFSAHHQLEILRKKKQLERSIERKLDYEKGITNWLWYKAQDIVIYISNCIGYLRYKLIQGVYLKLKRWLPDGNSFDIITFYLNRYTNKHGASWGRALAFTLMSTTIVYLLYLFSLGIIGFGKDYTFDAELIGYYFSFIDITRKPDFMKDYGTELNGWARGIGFFSRILIGFCIYQFIAAFRRHGKR